MKCEISAPFQAFLYSGHIFYAPFFIDWSRIGLLGSKKRDEDFVGVALWAWPCGHGPSEQSELLPSPQRSRPQGHAHKGLVPLLGTQKANSWSGNGCIKKGHRCKNSLKPCKNHCGRGYEKWAWRRKGEWILFPPPVHIYCHSNRTRKEPVI